VRDILGEVKQYKIALPENIKAQAQKATEVLDDTKIDVGHKLKVALPIIPGILSYETELSLKGGGNLDKAIQKLLARGQKKLN
jgi:hypothetical protein